MISGSVILLADADATSRNHLRTLLQSDGYQVVSFNSAQELIHHITEWADVDLFLIASKLPDFTLKDTCTFLREHSSAPILILADSVSDSFLLRIYEYGADDVINATSSEPALLAKVKSLLRRYLVYRGKSKDSQGILLDEEKHIVMKNGQTIKMTDLEMSILEYMLAQNGNIVSIQQIYEGVWGEKYFPPSANTVMVHILNIRKKLEDDVSHPQLVRTVWGKGYKMTGISLLRDTSTGAIGS